MVGPGLAAVAVSGPSDAIAGPRDRRLLDVVSLEVAIGTGVLGNKEVMKKRVYWRVLRRRRGVLGIVNWEDGF